ncbi:hypothetical protein BKA69DRAFT_1128532 [Paraphysoderma sedebokerense]|nr:hypothetical protein BKA69DRAFT_1128532 [Paraphysoderma sedebokerense]
MSGKKRPFDDIASSSPSVSSFSSDPSAISPHSSPSQRPLRLNLGGDPSQGSFTGRMHSRTPSDSVLPGDDNKSYQTDHNNEIYPTDAHVSACPPSQPNLPKRQRFDEPQTDEFLLDHLHNVVRRWDLINDVIIWSPKIELLLGYNPSSIPSNSEWWRDLIHSDDRERVIKSMDRFFESHISKFWCEEYRLKVFTLAHSVPEYITVIDQIHVIRDIQGKPIKAIGAMFNPKQRSKMEEVLGTHRARLMRNIPHGKISADELRYQTQLIKTITDNTTSGLFMMDAMGHPTFMNPAAEKITGYKLSDISTRPLHYAVHYKRPDGSHYPMEECPVDNSQAALVPMQNQEEVFVDKYGRLFPVVWSIAPLEKDGKTVGAVLEFRDVTEEKAAEAERLKTKLEAEQQLVRAQEADAHRRVLTEFVDYVCHEIRNPLHGIAANMEFLAGTLQKLHNLVDVNCKCPGEGQLSAVFVEGREHLESIKQCVDHQTLITNNVLDLSRLEAGKVELYDEVFDPRDLLHQTVNILRGKILAKNVVINEELPSQILTPISPSFPASVSASIPNSNKDIHSSTPPPLVKGDATRLRQIFVNLVSNAVKFTPPNGNIILRLEPLVREGAHVKLTGVVQDNGVGLEKNELASLFKRFSQTNKKISSEYGGSGLGLSICDQIVRLMKGSIQADSEKGVGSTFKFSVYVSEPSHEETLQYLSAKSLLQSSNSLLPDGTSNSQPFSQTSSESNSKSQTTQSNQSLQQQTPHKRFQNVLIVEDNLINQRIVSKFVERLGYTPSVVSNGKEAVDLIEASLRASSTQAVRNGRGGDKETDLNDPRDSYGTGNNKVVPMDIIIMDMEMPVMDGRQASKRIRELEQEYIDLSSQFHTPHQSPIPASHFPTPSNTPRAPTHHVLNSPQSTNLNSPQHLDSSIPPTFSSTTSPSRTESTRIPIIALSGNARPAKISEAIEHGIDDYLIKPCNQERLKQVIEKWEMKCSSR